MDKEKDIFKPLDDEERELILDIEAGEFRPYQDARGEIAIARQYAESAIKKDKRMNIRISERDLKKLKIKALQEGIPYQTMVSMVLHKYVTGKLREVS